MNVWVPFGFSTAKVGMPLEESNHVILIIRLSRALTAPKRHVPAATSTNCCAISSATLVWASTVLAPKCGVHVTRGCFTIALDVGGSSQNTSKPAPAHFPESIALMRASSSMIPPRAQLMTRMPFLHLLKTSSLMRSEDTKHSLSGYIRRQMARRHVMSEGLTSHQMARRYVKWLDVKPDG